MTTTNRYTGKVVTAERINPDKENSGYYDGQYLITHETATKLYGVRVDGTNGGLTVYGLGGYSGVEGGLPLTGRGAYRIASVEEPRPWMLEALDRVDEEIDAVRKGTRKAHWVGNVYDNAFTKVRKVREVLEYALLAKINIAAADMDQGDQEGCDQTDGPERDLPVLDVHLPPGAAVRARPGCVLRVFCDAA